MAKFSTGVLRLQASVVIEKQGHRVRTGMFAVEVSFTDGVSQSEVIFVRRPQALIGASDYAHVVIEDMKPLQYQLRLTRDIGRNFRCKPVGLRSRTEGGLSLQNSYSGEAVINTGPVKFSISSLDIDLSLKESEAPDRAGVRVMRAACSSQSPRFPAVMVSGSDPLIVSFVPGNSVLIGRSSQCSVRLDSSEVSARHARIGYESGQFWIEDLGSTNGTFVNQQQISGRVNITPGSPVMIGRETILFGVTSEDQIQSLGKTSTEPTQAVVDSMQRYPIIISASEVVRPARVALQPGRTWVIGRDPNSDVWIGAPHVSRKHVSVEMTKTGIIVIQDHSTNGTAYDDGLMRKGDRIEFDKRPCVLNFGGSVTVGLCFSEEEERQFVDSSGSPTVFKAGTEEDFRVASVGPQHDNRAVSDSGSGIEGTFVGAIGPRMERTNALFSSLSAPMKVLVIALIFSFVFVVYLLIEVFSRAPS